MKTLITILAFFLLGLSNANANYVNYAFEDWKWDFVVHKVFVPENIEYSEYLYMTWQLDVDSYSYRLIRVNVLLIKRGLDAIYN